MDDVTSQPQGEDFLSGVEAFLPPEALPRTTSDLCQNMLVALVAMCGGAVELGAVIDKAQDTLFEMHNPGRVKAFLDMIEADPKMTRADAVLMGVALVGTIIAATPQPHEKPVLLGASLGLLRDLLRQAEAGPVASAAASPPG